MEKNIRELKASGMLKRAGPDKGGHCEVLKTSLNKSFTFLRFVFCVSFLFFLIKRKNKRKNIRI